MVRFVKQIYSSIKSTDIVLWVLCLLASAYGLLLIASMSRAGVGKGMGFFVTQFAATVLGYTIAMIISFIDYDFFTRKWPIFAIIAIAMLIYTLIFGWGPDGVDDHTWISVGPISMQPSEIVKIFFLITFAQHVHFLESTGKLKTFLGLITLGIHALVPIAFIHMQGDDGTALVFLVMFAFMIFGCKIHMRYFIIAVVAAVISLPILWNYFFDDDQKSRFLAVFDLDSSMLGSGWQQYQGKLSIASGGFWGRGLFKGPRVSSGVVPFQENDFIFTVAGEELGFVGCALLIALLFAICFRILYIGFLSHDIKGRCICFGCFGMLFAQTTINIAMCLGFIPVIGVTLPFFSSGGSSVLCLCLGLGVVQSVYSHRDKDDVIQFKYPKKFNSSVI